LGDIACRARGMQMSGEMPAEYISLERFGNLGFETGKKPKTKNPTADN